MRRINCMSNRLMSQLSDPFSPPTLDHLTSRGAFGRHARQGFEASGVSDPKFAIFLGHLEGLHSKGLNDPQTNHGLRRVTPFWGVNSGCRIAIPCETRFSTIQPPVMKVTLHD